MFINIQYSKFKLLSERVVMAQHVMDRRDCSIVDSIGLVNDAMCTSDDVAEVCHTLEIVLPTLEDIQDVINLYQQLGVVPMPPVASSTNVQVGDEVVYIDYPSEIHFPAIVVARTDRDGLCCDLNVIYALGQETRRNGAQYSEDGVSHTWHMKVVEAPAEAPVEVETVTPEPTPEPVETPVENIPEVTPEVTPVENSDPILATSVPEVSFTNEPQPTQYYGV